MKRREFITLGGAAAAWPLAARAQQREQMRRIGVLMPYPKDDPEMGIRVRAFRQELAKLGWADGVNVQFDERWTADHMDRVWAEAASLIAANPDVILATGGRVIPVLLQLSRSIPIVMPGASDPLRVGWATSLARPGGNITGFTMFEVSIFGKMLALLKQIAPAITRVAFIYNPDNPNTIVYRRTIEDTAGPIGIEPIAVPIHGFADIDRAVAALADRQNSGVLFPTDLTTFALRDEIVALIARHHLPAIYSDPAFTRAGGLAFYGPDRVDVFRRSAGYVDRILHGEKAGDLPFQQPTKYVLILNLKTAKTLGLELSPTLLALADEVIE
ncbi:MAG TPA: ABC transporter substrate-binding protein [Bradyrhizobium sp.]|nr:ABC transporter substrate-binding protein [Bradyrhizobium sp.]